MKRNKYLIASLALMMGLALTAAPAMAKNGAEDGGPSGKSKSSSSKSSKSSKSSSSSSSKHTGLDDAAKAGARKKPEDGLRQQRHTGINDAAAGKADDGLHQTSTADDAVTGSLDDNAPGTDAPEAEVRHQEADDAAKVEGVETAVDTEAPTTNDPGFDNPQKHGLIDTIKTAFVSMFSKLFN